MNAAVCNPVLTNLPYTASSKIVHTKNVI